MTRSSLDRAAHSKPCARTDRRGPLFGKGVADVAWLKPDGFEMKDWDAGFARSIGVYLSGDGLTPPARRRARARPAPQGRRQTPAGEHCDAGARSVQVYRHVA